MPELQEALTFFVLVLTFTALYAAPTIVYRLARPASRASTDEALAIADEVRAELAEVVEAIKAQTEQLEAWAAGREEREERAVLDYDRSPVRIATPG